MVLPGGHDRRHQRAPSPTRAGWTAAYLPVGVADFTGDGQTQMHPCRTDIDSFQVSPIGASPIELANGCGKETFLGVTDYTGDGRPDVIARDNTTGNILVAANDSTGGWLNDNTTIIATDW